MRFQLRLLRARSIISRRYTIEISFLKSVCILLFCGLNEVNMLSSLLQIKHNDVMEPGMRIHLPVSVAEGEIRDEIEKACHPQGNQFSVFFGAYCF